ncbi:hypothetical protein HN425_02485 [Candidatus Woesearchaeota archaeon]|jgi:hypothetical protein|nr:hypothetical protein [Candidatus Woesearchaeota archaeon]MBT7705918.1 hypothetical protein [archaeon]
MVVGPMTFQGDLLLMVAIVFGVIATITTFINSQKLKGEVFEVPMIYFSLGILLTTFSLVAVTFFELSAVTLGLIHDISFIIGLALMLVASIKLTRYLSTLEDFAKKVNKKK